MAGQLETWLGTCSCVGAHPPNQRTPTAGQLARTKGDALQQSWILLRRRGQQRSVPVQCLQAGFRLPGDRGSTHKHIVLRVV